MKIIFFSTNASIFNEKTYLIKTLPSFQSQYETFIKTHTKNTFLCISQKPCLFMPEKSTIICDSDDTQEFATFIKSHNPHFVIPLSFWSDDYDWLPLKDSLICQELKKMNINCISNTLETSLICFNKTDTFNFLNKNNIKTSPSFYINHDLFFCASNKKEIKYNVYKEAVFSKIENMNYPLIIKDPTSFSSYNIQVINTIGEAKNYLNSKKHNSDRLIQEFIDGKNIGLEVYGFYNKKNKYKCIILPSFTFSVNQYGITSPKLSLKYGPIFFSPLLKSKLNKTIKKLSKNLKLTGPFQIDLILRHNNFYVIEINPRLSGLTSSYFSSLNKNFYNMIYELLILHKKYYKKNFAKVLNIKIPLLDYEKLEEIKSLAYVCFINQINNLEAKQEREKGYCEIIIKGKNKKDLKQNLSDFICRYPHFFQSENVEKAISLIDSRF